ncbi:uncharacterized protein TRIVIDRAFT_193312 [Trichoderma virens Gv29-8]|uniref:FAD-binding PCMH-type domain-containing protein n=1 Tax=Hypocrea virens (strain Gv29-8 / FGSC 10586) TaxID=413071 RepID=G9N0Q4_HYPVG|nr:uncharacterized protein TRIVIDRAFT_193312 [Trichoderma virens Gv29-8]EHK19936.1 hypothetical protein TRIVIDRAFT_193312 [Trichoderma virens Gv29-8]UKZ53313.1 hypothetical protein TrVGV298_007105 [Trichoderma virens]
MSSVATIDAGRKAVSKYGTSFYFIAQAAQIAPACRILPVNTADVSEILNVVRETGTTFAVKAGGHCSYPSGTNAENGITIDLSRLKDIKISDNRKSVTVGAGCRFGEVYRELEAHGLGCVGGRVSSVGVSGLTLGGGISFFSTERGLACDNVVSYELVIANGQVLSVTKVSHPDLFWGMRGAGITFGIVTSFELKTFDLGEIWGGSSTFAHENETAVLEAFDKFVHADQDPLAEAFLVVADMAKDGNSVYTMVLSHSNPQSDTSVFNDFKNLTPLASSTQTRTLTNFCDELDSRNESGFRYRTNSLSVKCHLTTLKEIAAIHEECVHLLKDCDGFVPTLLYQPLLGAMLPKDDVSNALGIKPEDTPLIVIALLWKWTDIQHDKLISQVADQFVEKVEKATRAYGTFHRYQYLNYAANYQDVYGGYGEENRKRLLEIRAKYDPEGLMSILRPGIIQLSGQQEM